MSKDPKSPSEPLGTSLDSAEEMPLPPKPIEARATSPSSPLSAVDPPASKLPPKFVLHATLEEELSGDDFALRGWHRMIDLADYVSHLVDGRSTGLLAAEAPTYGKVLALATVLKAAVQWFRLDAESRPKFVVEAERYLAEQPLDEPIAAPLAYEPNATPIFIRSGPVAARKGGRGSAGRQEAMLQLKERVIKLLEAVSHAELHVHQEAFTDPSAPKPRQRWVLAWAIADALIFVIPTGFLAGELQQQGFVWKNWDDQRRKAGEAAFDVLEDADLNEEHASTRADLLGELAELLVRRMLTAIGMVPDKDLFRVRRH
jgi:hypothetical protein